jgi:hypothetical protein
MSTQHETASTGKIAILQAYVQYLSRLLLWSRFQACNLSCFFWSATVSESLKFLGPTLNSVTEAQPYPNYKKNLQSSSQMTFFMLTQEVWHRINLVVKILTSGMSPL